MQPLPTEHAERHFTYAQVERHGNVAIFTQTHKASGTVRYEVVRIRVEPAHTWPNGDTSPEREVYPNSGRWGTDGATCFTLAEAQALAEDWGTPQQAVVGKDTDATYA